MLAPTHPLQLALGLGVWSVWFVVWYGGLSLACAVAAPSLTDGAITWVNLVLTLFSLPVALVLAYWARRSGRALKHPGLSSADKVIAWVGAAGHWAGAVAVLAMTLPSWVYPPCV